MEKNKNGFGSANTTSQGSTKPVIPRPDSLGGSETNSAHGENIKGRTVTPGNRKG